MLEAWDQPRLLGDTILNFWLNWLYDNGSLPGRC